jgi:hypothetical protein
MYFVSVVTVVSPAAEVKPKLRAAGSVQVFLKASESPQKSAKSTQ